MPIVLIFIVAPFVIAFFTVAVIFVARMCQFCMRKVTEDGEEIRETLGTLPEMSPAFSPEPDLSQNRMYGFKPILYSARPHYNFSTLNLLVYIRLKAAAF